MAYQYIDDSAFPGATSDGPLSSPVGVLTRRNIEQIYTERCPHGGWALPYGEVWRVCSCWPVSWPVGMVYVDSDDSGCQITVQIRHNEIDWSVDDASPPASSSDAIEIAVSVMTMDGRAWVPDASEYTMLVKTTTDTTVTLTADTHGWSGWLGILLWTKSVVQDEDGVSPVTLTGDSAWRGIEVSSLGSIASHPPERSVVISALVDKGVTYVQQGVESMIGDWVTDSGRYVLHIVPTWGRASDEDPASAFWGAGNVVQYRTMGVISIVGVSWRLTPPAAPLPGERSYYTDRPVTERGAQGLVGSLIRTTRRRVPIWSTDPGMYLDGTDWVRWPKHTVVLTYATIHAACVDAPMVGAHSGWEAVVGLLLTRPETWGDVNFVARLQAYEMIAGTWTLSDSNESDINTLFAGPTYGSRDGGGWFPDQPPYAQTLWGCDRYTVWQMRGALLDPSLVIPGSERMPDLRHVKWITVRLDPATVDVGATYPIRLELQLSQTSGAAHLTSAVVFSAIRSLPLGWEV